MKKVFVIVGAAGTGKTTVQSYLQQQYQMAKVVTHTTRPARVGEVDGVDYYFETPTSFHQLKLLETVEYDHYQYGSSQEALERAWQGHPAAVIVLDSKGAQTYCQQLGSQVVVIFLTVSNQAILAQRLAQRGDDPAAIQSRINSAEFKRDLTLPDQLTDRAYVINNEDWNTTRLQLDRLVLRELVN